MDPRPRYSVWTEEDLATAFTQRMDVRYVPSYVRAIRRESELMDSLTALAGVAPAVKLTLLALGELS